MFLGNAWQERSCYGIAVRPHAESHHAASYLEHGHRRHRTAIIITFITIASALPYAQIVNILTNGSFEQNFTGWSATGNQLVATGDATRPPSDGASVVVLNPGASGSSDAVLSQTFTTTPNQRYGLSFDVGRVGGVIDGRLRVTVQGSAVIVDKVLEFTGINSNPFYIPQHITFVANSTSTTLTFRDMSISPLMVDSLLDNVRVTTEPTGAPSITTDPQRLAVMQGRSATFTVAATGTGPLTYQWRFNGANIPNATSNTLTLPAVTTSNAGVYNVVVTNSSGSVSSSGATLLVLPTAILLNGSFEYGTAAWTLNDINRVYTTLNPIYQFTDGVQLMHFSYGQRPNGGSISQTFPTTPGTQYLVGFDVGAASSVNHDEQRLEVRVQGQAPTALLFQQISVFATGNGTAYSSQLLPFVADSNTATITFTDTSLTTLDVDLVLDNMRVVVADAAPVITSQPQSVTVAAGSPASFSVTATGAAPLTYQWRFNGTPITGATASTYAIASAQPSQAGSYTVVVSNLAGPTTSTAATLTVTSSGGSPFTNGSFEADFTGWTTTGNQRIVSGSFWVATDGVKAVAFNAGQQPANAVLAQSFATTIGQTYTLAFDVGAISGVSQDEQRLQATVQGQSATPLVSQTISVFAPGNGTQYVARSFTFVADSTLTTLTFRDMSPTTDSIDLMLDNVRVTAGP